MKNQIAKVLAVIAVISITQVARATGIQDLQGTWEVVDRICTDGNQAQDRFQAGRDSIEMVVSGSQAQITSRIEGEVFTSSGTILQSQRQLVTTDSSGKVNSELYLVGKNNELALFNAEFGKGGSCAEREGLMTVLKKK